MCGGHCQDCPFLSHPIQNTELRTALKETMNGWEKCHQGSERNTSKGGGAAWLHHEPHQEACLWFAGNASSIDPLNWPWATWALSEPYPHPMPKPSASSFSALLRVLQIASEAYAESHPDLRVWGDNTLAFRNTQGIEKEMLSALRKAWQGQRRQTKLRILSWERAHRKVLRKLQIPNRADRKYFSTEPVSKDWRW